MESKKLGAFIIVCFLILEFEANYLLINVENPISLKENEQSRGTVVKYRQ